MSIEDRITEILRTHFLERGGVMAELDDGFGNVWVLCKPDCRLEIVRPGKVQCDCDYEDEDARAAEL